MSRRLLLIAVVATSIAACGDSAPTPAGPGAVLTRRDAEPAGANCAAGGTAIRVGHDSNGNGVLDDAEIEQTQYVCDGAPELVREDPIAPGAQCPGGGTAVSVGVDDNGDGVLEDVEIDQTTIVCDSTEIWTGDFTAADWSDPVKVAALHGAHVVTGALTIDTDGDVTLPMLELVNGDLVVGGATTGLELPALRQVGGAVTVDAPGLPAVSLGGLQRVVGDVAFTSNGAPGTSIAAPALVEVGGKLSFSMFAEGDVSLPALTTIGGDLYLHASLTSFHADALATIGGSLVGQDFDLPVLRLPALATIGGDLDTNSAIKLTTIDLPALTAIGGKLWLLGNSALTSLSVPALASVGDQFTIDDSAALTHVDFPHLATIGGGLMILTPTLTAIALPALQTVGHFSAPSVLSIAIQKTAVTGLDLPALTSADGTIDFDRNDALTTISFAKLDDTATILSIGGPALVQVSAPSATHLNAVLITETGHIALAFPKLTTLDGALQLGDMQLDDLSGFTALTSVGFLNLEHCAGLHDLTGLSALASARSIELTSDLALISLDGLEQITQVPGHLSIVDDEALTSTAGLRNLEHVGGLLDIEEDSVLTSLAFDHLYSVGGALSIRFLEKLTSFDGLAHLQIVVGKLDLFGLTDVPAGEIAAFRQRLGK